jgi:serine/threonine-protein kinase
LGACPACGAEAPAEGHERSAEDAVGRVIADQFELERLIGVGSMGSVYAARQRSLDKRVAIKLLHPHLVADPRSAKRFHREARAASRLSHPNSLQIIDFGADEDGTQFLVMELLDGVPLDEVADRSFPLSPARIAHLLGQVLAALGEAHRAQIVHRDLKPENIVVSEAAGGVEHVTVCDFGIAKVGEVEGGSAITVSGFVCGTPEFMAPEQARGEPLDARADVYAAGCVLYQLLTNEMPFRAETALGTITKHLHDAPVPPHRRRPDLAIPSLLERVCLRAMEKAPEARFQSAEEMRRALDEAVDSLGDAARAPIGAKPERGGRAPFRRIPVILAVVGGVVLAVGLFARVHAPPEREAARPADSSSQRRDRPAAPAASSSSGRAASETTVALGDQPPDAGGRDRRAAGGPAASTKTAPPAEASTVPSTPHAAPEKPERSSPQEPDSFEPVEGGATGTRTKAVRERTESGRESGPRREGSRAAEQAFAAGRKRFLASDLEGAIRQFERATTLSPSDPRAYRELGRARMRTGAVDDAIRAYRRYLELAPEAPDRAVVKAIVEGKGER